MQQADIGKIHTKKEGKTAVLVTHLVHRRSQPISCSRVLVLSKRPATMRKGICSAHSERRRPLLLSGNTEPARISNYFNLYMEGA